MDRENERLDDLIDLGAATVETQGPSGTRLDVVSLQIPAGLRDDD